MLAIDEIRARFPYLSQCTYLNTASAGLSWQGQGAAAAAFYDLDKSKGINAMEQWRTKADATRAAVATLLLMQARNVHFLGSTSEALNLIALSIPLARGAQVAMAQDEFPSIVSAWQQSRGAEIVSVPIARESERSEALAAAVGPSTRVLAVSHVHWRTGTKVDLTQLSAACSKHDCLLVVDGAHAVGAVPVNGANVDAYCAPVFKWLLSGFGLGFAALSDRLGAQLEPALRGYANGPPSRSIAYSHSNYPGIYALHATLVQLDAFGWGEIHAQVATLARYVASELRRCGFDLLTPRDAQAGIVSFRHPQGPWLVRSLANQSIFVEDSAGLVRVSPHFYNTHQELDRLIDALMRIA